jgi:hypothetical protein
MLKGCSMRIPPEPVLTLTVMVLPMLRWMLPDPLPHFQSVVGLPLTSMSQEPVPA